MKKTILITGASSGIGYVIAKKLHEEGFNVFGTSRNPDKVHGDLPFPLLKLDITDQQSISEFTKIFFEKSPNLDVLINNAGVMLSGISEEVSQSQARDHLEANFWGPVNVTQAFLPHFRKQRHGKIISIGSIMGIVGMPTSGFYAAAKHALEGYFKSLRYEVAQFGIGISIVEPSFFKSNISHSGVQAASSIKDYDNLRTKANRFSETSLLNAPDPAAVAVTVLKIVNASRPKLSYPVGNGTTLLPLLQYFSYNSLENGVKKQIGF